MDFRFRYEALLSYRRHMKEKAEIDFSRAHQRLRACRIVLENLENQYRTTKTILESDLRGKIPSDLLKSHSDYIAALKNRIGNQKLEVAEREEVVKREMETLLMRTKHYKVIEKLKEKDLERWQREQLGIEQKITNEVAIMRHGKNLL